MSTPEQTAAATPKDNLFTELQALDRGAHRQMRLARLVHSDHSPARGMNSMFANAVEFLDLAREYPVVFVRAGDPAANNGKLEVSPVAVLGLKRGENLYLKEDGSWSASYVPAMLRSYPFALVHTEDNNYIVCFDKAWSGFSEQEGERLFDDAGEPTEFMKGVQSYLEQLDAELQRTRAFCQRLVELDLLQDMRFDAQMEDGQTLVVDGFLAVNEQKLAELPDATVVELHRAGILALLYAHIGSMAVMRRLVERRVALKLPV
ncbi:MAG: SapC family protein [Betaproteobacteria bacterium]